MILNFQLNQNYEIFFKTMNLHFFLISNTGNAFLSNMKPGMIQFDQIYKIVTVEKPTSKTTNKNYKFKKKNRKKIQILT